MDYKTNIMACCDIDKFIPINIGRSKYLKEQITHLLDYNPVRKDSCCLEFSEDTLYTYIVYGQSNGTGMSFQFPTGFTNISISDNKKVIWDSNSRNELIVTDNTTIQSGALSRVTNLDNGAYDPAVIGANQLSQIFQNKENKRVQFISMNPSWNGAPLANISPLSDRWLMPDSSAYVLMIQAINRAKEYATSIGKKLVVPFVVFNHGETNVLFADATGITPEEYRDTLVELVDTFYTDIHAITGQLTFPKWYITQVSWDTSGNDSDMLIKMAQYISNRNTVIPTYPTYQLSCLSGFNHYEGNSTVKWTASVARSIYRDINNKNIIFDVNSIRRTGNKLILKFNVPVKPIRFDISRGLSPNHGFYITDSLDAVVNITNVDIVAPDEVKLTTDQTLTTGNVYYQYTKPYMLLPTNLERNTRAGSYVADSDTTLSIVGAQIPNYLLAFKLPF